MRDVLAVLIPVLGRPEEVARALEDLLASVSGYPVEPMFICTPSDRDQIRAVLAAGATPYIVPFERGSGDYARKMNYGIAHTDTRYIFLGADDLHFHPGWFHQARVLQEKTGACVIGTNDMGNQRTISGMHSTHTLIHRGYTECGAIDDESRLLHEGYDHCFVDDEFVQTAKARGTYQHSIRSWVEHLHPDWGKGETDETYALGKAHFEDDRQLYNARCSLWKGVRR